MTFSKTKVLLEGVRCARRPLQCKGETGGDWGRQGETGGDSETEISVSTRLPLTEVPLSPKTERQRDREIKR